MNRAVFVAAGIMLQSRRGFRPGMRVCAHYFGLRSEAADAFNASYLHPEFPPDAVREGAPPSFIPVHASLVSKGRGAEADRVAGAIGAVMAAIVSVIVLLGWWPRRGWWRSSPRVSPARSAS